MALSSLIDSWTKCQEQLLSAIQADADYGTVQALDEQLAFLVNSIRNLHLSAASDINRQIKFFLHRSEGLVDSSVSEGDLEALESLIDRYMGVDAALSKFGDSPSTISAHAIVNLENSRFVTDDLIEQSDARVSLYNRDYRYEYTNLRNAKFHNTDPAEFVGKHVADIVGDLRFQKRAKQYFDSCFSGDHQKYSYFLDVPDMGERLMGCQLTPYRDGDGSVRGAFFTVEDLTDKLNRASQSAVSKLAPDR